MARDEHITILFRKYVAGTYTLEELDALLRYFEMEEASEQLTQLIEHALANPVPDPAYAKRVKAIQDRVADRLVLETPSRRLRWLPYAAAVVMAFALGWFFLQYGQQNKQLELAGADLAPGGNRATLSVGDGPALSLDSTQAGIVFSGDRVMYSNSQPVEGLILRNDNFDDTVVPLTLATPKGGMYQVTLPDGTEVWLNSASTLTYPSRFEGNERLVTLHGEGYFSVARDAAKPFRVAAQHQTVEVLGTEFNISAYADEPETKTTLVEGKVRVGGHVLNPSQQAVTRGGRTAINRVDVSAATAWKSGKFDFSEQTLETIMRQIARWYDVEVAYDGVDKNEQYWGSVSRFSNISQVLTKLEQTGDLRFTIKERRVTVSKIQIN